MSETITTRSISEAAHELGLTAHTLRYYEREGLLLTPLDRESSDRRRYTDGDIAWLGFLRKLRSTAMPIATLRRYVELARAGDSTRAARLALLREHRETVLARRAELDDALGAIDFKIALYSERLPS